jgi:hypothetical protein
MKNDNSDKVAFIKSLGFTDVEDFGDTIGFEGDCPMDIDVDDIKLTDTAKDIERKANKYSCCGDVLDDDYMICPTCKEHC